MNAETSRVIDALPMNTASEDRRRAVEASGVLWWLQPSTREHYFRSIGDNIEALDKEAACHLRAI